MTLVADAFTVPRTTRAWSRGPLAASVLLHLLVLAAALLLLRPQPHEDAADLESVAVSIITMQSASDTIATEQSDAAQTMIAAGTVSPATAETIEPVSTEATISPTANAVTPTRLDVVSTPRSDPVAIASVEPLPPAAAASGADVQELSIPPAAATPMEIATAEPTDAIAPAPLLAVAAPAPDSIAPDTASVELAAAAQPVPTSPAAEATVVAPARTPAADPIDPVETETVVKPVAESVQPAEVQPPAPPVAKAPAPAKPKPQPKPPVKQKSAGSGNGGKSDANAQAASGTRGGAGKTAVGGSAAESQYPGLILARLKRALRFPPGAGNASGQAMVRFLVAANGSVSDIEIVQSTGSSVLDNAARDTVRRAAPYPPIPASTGRSAWSFTMPLLFRRQ